MASKRVKDTISKFRTDILSGAIASGSVLPAEMQLSAEMKLSRPTVAKIYNTLQQEGLVKKTPGRGTVVVYNENVKKNTFGLLLPGAGESEIFGQIHDHFLSLEKQKDVKFLWEGSIANNAQMRQNTILQICEAYRQEGIKGVFFAPLERTDHAGVINTRVCELFDRAKIPVILIDRDIVLFPERSRYHVVGLDNFNAGYVMARHFIEAGCEKIYFFQRPDSATSIHKRVAGCHSACFDAGIAFRKENIIVGEPSDLATVKKIRITSGKTGIICANDSTAAVMMGTLNQLGIRVAKDVLVSGYDDMKYAKVLHLSLTTFRQPLFDIVTNSYDLMLNRIESPASIGADLTLLGELVPRESTRFA